MVYLNYIEKKKDCTAIAVVKNKSGTTQDILYLHTEEDPIKKSQQLKEVNLPVGNKFEVIPPTDEDKRSVYYIAGASGSGKSYVAGQISSSYKKLFPNNEVYLISKLNEDSTLDSLTVGKPKRINIDSILDDPPKIEEFRNCLVIFDDYDGITGKLGKAILELITDIAITGRHTATNLILCTHHISNYSKTRLLLNEATHYILYPQSSSFNALKHLLIHYLGMDTDEIKALKNIKSRWVCFHKNYPQYQLSQTSCKILHQ
jgi:hypothetical protein